MSGILSLSDAATAYANLVGVDASPAGECNGGGTLIVAGDADASLLLDLVDGEEPPCGGAHAAPPGGAAGADPAVDRRRRARDGRDSLSTGAPREPVRLARMTRRLIRRQPRRIALLPALALVLVGGAGRSAAAPRGPVRRIRTRLRRERWPRIGAPVRRPACFEPRLAWRPAAARGACAGRS